MVMLVITTPFNPLGKNVMYAGGGRGKFKSRSENDLKAVSQQHHPLHDDHSSEWHSSYHQLPQTCSSGRCTRCSVGLTTNPLWSTAGQQPSLPTHDDPVSLSSDTVSRSGMFCAIATTIDRCKTESVVDVFQVVKAPAYPEARSCSHSGEYPITQTTHSLSHNLIHRSSISLCLRLCSGSWSPLKHAPISSDSKLVLMWTIMYCNIVRQRVNIVPHVKCK